MQYLNVKNLSKRYGEKLLFEGVDLIINQGEKVALVAANGAGKSSFIKALSGIESAEEGTILFSKDIRVEYLFQEPELQENLSVLENVLFADNSATRAIIAYENALLKQSSEKELNGAIANMDAANAWDYESNVKQVLSKLNCPPNQTKVNVLSGGEKKRVALAKVLINEPDFLILDEPTNHLDLDMIEWLENYLCQSKLTLFMVTHDRYFLENICNRIVELDPPPNGLDGPYLHSYPGNYSNYVTKRELRRENEEANLAKAQNLLRGEKEWMSRMPKARGTKAKARIESFYELKRKASAVRSKEEISLQINPERLGSKIIELHNLGKSYGEKKLFNKFNYKFKRYDKVGVIGPNGSGKSTFIKTIIGELEPDQGKVVIGETVKFGMYSQDGMVFKEGQKVIEVIRDVAEYIPLKGGGKLTALQLLERFLFPKGMHYVHVSRLSGGEKRRLYLLTILMRNPNFLILDEPTNDLDILTLNVLEDFLQDYSGSLLVVSHDRYFMDKLVDHLFVFGNDGEVSDFPGNYTHYRLRLEDEESTTPKHQSKDEKKSVVEVGAETERKLTYEERKAFNRLEKEIEKLEKSKVALEEKMANNPDDFNQLLVWTGELNKIISAIDIKSEEWLELSEFA